MATGKRYYWMKLKESFMTSDTIDYFMGQPDGANYVVLYQKHLATRLAEISALTEEEQREINVAHNAYKNLIGDTFI